MLPCQCLPSRPSRLTPTLPAKYARVQVYSVPLVGVWVRGTPSGLDHPMVLAACLRFACSTGLPDRVLQPDGAFLLLIFPPGEAQGRVGTHLRQPRPAVLSALCTVRLCAAACVIGKFPCSRVQYPA